MKTLRSMLDPHRPQVAALPVRLGRHGHDVLLITSRETGRWLIPKGWPIKGVKDRDAAATEAVEEAGVRGTIAKRPLGAYTYNKRLADRLLPCRVMVYRLDVEVELETWRESRERTRRWFTPGDAAQIVSEPGLRAMIMALRASEFRSPSELERGFAVALET